MRVLQGSMFGPILSLLCIDDIVNFINDSLYLDVDDRSSVAVGKSERKHKYTPESINNLVLQQQSLS